MATLHLEHLELNGLVLDISVLTFHAKGLMAEAEAFQTVTGLSGIPRELLDQIKLANTALANALKAYDNLRLRP